MHTKDIKWFGFAAVLACDGLCAKAWGISNRPKVSLGEDEDDVAWLADSELGEAPTDPGAYEGGCAKPTDPSGKNRWCARECERGVVANSGQPITLKDFSRRLLNQPWKHETPNGPVERAAKPSARNRGLAGRWTSAPDDRTQPL